MGRGRPTRPGPTNWKLSTMKCTKKLTPEQAQNGNSPEIVEASPPAPADNLEVALAYLRLGFSVLADCPPDHQGMSKKHRDECKNPGKVPWHRWKEYQDRLPTEQEVRSLFTRMPKSNIGLALGPVSGLVRVDIDGPGGEQMLAELSGGELPDTWEFTSGRENGGRGLLYKIPNGVTLKTTKGPGLAKHEELRFQAKGAQTVLPPSRHPTGCLYAWKMGHSPFEIKQAAEVPRWLIDLLQADKEPSHVPSTPTPTAKPVRQSNGAGIRGSGPITVVERARRYIAKRDPAVSGQRGHDAAWRVAQDLICGFALTVEDCAVAYGRIQRAMCPPVVGTGD